MRPVCDLPPPTPPAPITSLLAGLSGSSHCDLAVPASEQKLFRLHFLLLLILISCRVGIAVPSYRHSTCTLNSDSFLPRHLFNPGIFYPPLTTTLKASSSCGEVLGSKSQDESLQHSMILLEQRFLGKKKKQQYKPTAHLKKLILQLLIIHSCGASSSQRILGSVTESI